MTTSGGLVYPLPGDTGLMCVTTPLTTSAVAQHRHHRRLGVTRSASRDCVGHHKAVADRGRGSGRSLRRDGNDNLRRAGVSTVGSHDADLRHHAVGHLRHRRCARAAAAQHRHHRRLSISRPASRDRINNHKAIHNRSRGGGRSLRLRGEGEPRHQHQRQPAPEGGERRCHSARGYARVRAKGVVTS